MSYQLHLYAVPAKYDIDYNSGFKCLVEDYIYTSHGGPGTTTNRLTMADICENYTDITVKSALNNTTKMLQFDIFFEPIKEMIVEFDVWFQVNSIKYGKTHLIGVCAVDPFMFQTEFCEERYNFFTKIDYICLKFENMVFSEL